MREKLLDVGGILVSVFFIIFFTMLSILSLIGFVKLVEWMVAL